MVAYTQANFSERSDVKVLGTCLFQTGKLQAQMKFKIHDTVRTHLRFVNQLLDLPHVQHLGSVKKVFLPR